MAEVEVIPTLTRVALSEKPFPRVVMAGIIPRAVELSLVDELDLAVDFDSDVEDELATDLWEDEKERSEGEIVLFKRYATELGYGDNPREFWEYYDKMQELCPSPVVESMLSYLRSHGVERWIKKYMIDMLSPQEVAFYALGVFLTKAQRKLGQKALLPLLRAAAFRVMRRRSPRRPLDMSNLRKYAMLEHVAERIKASKRIIVLSGAGISVSCGIPDFRSRNGLYAQLFSSGSYDLDDPQQMFDINYFKHNPYVFYSFAHKIYPSNFTPSRSHRFIKALETRGKLLRNYTQNIDGLESEAGITRLHQCHGSFATAKCINCKVIVSGSFIKDDLLAQSVPLCRCCNTEEDLKPKKIRRRKKKKKRNDGWESEDLEELPPLPAGIMKPCITFFGEKLGRSFDRKVFRDIKVADLVIVIGTSLKVRPVSEIISHLPHQVETVVINKTPLPHFYPDYQLLGDADVVVKHLARYLGWDIDGNAKSANQRPPDQKRIHSNSKYKVIGESGVILFRGAEGGRYVDELIARRKATGSLEPDGVADVYLTESDVSESEDGGRESMTGDGEGQARKRPRRSLAQKPSDFRTGW